MAAFAVCLLGADWIATRQGVEYAQRRASELATGVLVTLKAVDAQADAAIADAVQTPFAVCSNDDIERLQMIQARFHYVAAVGRFSAGSPSVACSSLGSSLQEVQFEEPDYISSGGRQIFLHPTPHFLNREYFIIAAHGVAIFVHKSISATILSTLDDASLGVYVKQDGRLLFSRGLANLDEIYKLERSGQNAFFTGERLLGVSRTPEGLVAFVDFPEARVTTNIREARTSILPLGTLLGMAVSLLAFFYLRDFTSLAATLKRAISSNQLYMEYQPIVRLDSGKCVGAEALVRWKHRGQSISPDRFIVAAEQAGMMPQVTAQILSLVAKDTADLLRTKPNFHISINLSALDLSSRNAIDLLSDMLKVTGISPNSYWIEITETSFSENDIGACVAEVRAMGIRVAMDDFGTGYSNLEMLGKIKVDLLKMDKRFVQSLPGGNQIPEVTLAIIGLARSLGLDMIAEGVETREQAEFLATNRVKFGQGWLFGRPGSVADLMLLDSRNSRNPTSSYAPLNV